MTDFKVGDKVIADAGGWCNVNGTVTDTSGSIWEYEVEDTKGRIGLFHAHELKLVKPEPKFAVGDIVKSVGFQYMRFDGKTLIVDSLDADEGYDYSVRALGEDWVPGHCFREDELVAGEELAEWEIELLDSSRPSLKSQPKTVKPEAVDGPAHYGGKDNPYEVIKVAEAWGFNENAYLFNALKYLGRAGKKGRKVEDLKKLVFYVEREIALEEAK